jgi:hypothetical protein
VEQIIERVIKTSFFVTGLLLAIGLYSVAILASEFTPLYAPVDAGLWSVFVSVFIGTGLVVAWLAIRRVSMGLSRLVLPAYIMFAIYRYLRNSVVELGVAGSIGEDIFFSNKIAPEHSKKGFW